jgi:hypothetical protein
MTRPRLHSLFAPPPVLLPVPVSESTRLTPGERLIWHKQTVEYGCWTSYNFVAASSPYLKRTRSIDRFVVDALSDPDFYRRARREDSCPPVAIRTSELWTVVPAPNDGYDPASDGGPVPTRSGVVAGYTVPAFDPAEPPIRRLHLATAVSGIVGARAWLMPIDGGPAEPGFRVASEPLPYDVSQEYDAIGLTGMGDGRIGASVALARDEHWWSAHDHGRPVHPDHVIRAPYIAVLIEGI